MPERTNYMALAANYHAVDDWCRRYGVKPSTVKVVRDMSSLRGVGDFSLIVFGGWISGSGADHLLIQTGDFAMSKAKQIYFPDTHKPIANESGVIVRWERKNI